VKYKELTDLNDDQLAARLRELQEEHFNLRFQLATRQLTNTARLRQVTRDIARVKTRQRELELHQMEGAR
jgi:large subunit ribosomal protein L29